MLALDFCIQKAPRQLDLSAPYPFPGMTQRRVAERGVQYLRWGLKRHARI